MAKQVKWTKQVFLDFCDYALLNDDEIYIMETRIKGVPVSIQASHLCVSESTVHRMIAKLKIKYDAVQKEYPDKFPIRKKSIKETWMDNN